MAFSLNKWADVGRALTRAEIDTNWTTIETALAGVNLAPINMLNDSGRFAGKIDPSTLVLGTGFAAHGFLTPYNNSGPWISAGKFVFDNSTNGGAGEALTADVQALLASMGRTGVTARYGVEFYLGQLTAGTGQAGAIGGSGYMLTINNTRVVYGAGGYATFGARVRAKSGTLYIGVPYYKNDTLVPAGTAITPAEGFVKIRVVHQTVLGYDNAFPYLGAVPGSIIQMALPVVTPGIADFGALTCPIPTLNGLNS